MALSKTQTKKELANMESPQLCVPVVSFSPLNKMEFFKNVERFWKHRNQDSVKSLVSTRL